MSRQTEADLIQKYFAPLCGEGAFQLRDDCAAISVPAGFDLVINVDSVTEEIDFFKNATAEEIAVKALRVNISDLAAKGAMPFGYVMSLSLPSLDDNWLAAFSAQFVRDQNAYEIKLLGGDTTKAPLICVSITAMGLVPSGGMVRRSGAAPGDVLCVTGTIGDSALGLQILKGKLECKDEELVQRYRYPEPPAKIARHIYQYATSALDISDGFIGDVTTLCESSSLGAKIQLNDVPFSRAAKAVFKQDLKWKGTALTGGDDYQIALTMKPENFQNLQKLCGANDIQLTHIGVMTSAADILFLEGDTPRTFTRGAYSHF